MMQTLPFVQSSPPRHGIAAMRAMTFAVPSSDTTRAGDVFFARTAPAGAASDDEREAIVGSVIEVIPVGKDRPLPVQSRSSGTLQLIIEGWAYRAHMLPDGARQITDILLPGDFLDWSVSPSTANQHDIRALERMQVAVMRKDVVTGTALLPLRLRWEWMRDAESHRLRSWLTSLGRRNARQRIAYFMAELHERLRSVGLVDAGAFTCPLTQEQLADALGLTSVHVNRTLQSLRREGLVVFDRPRVFIPDLLRLHAAAAFAESATCSKLGG